MFSINYVQIYEIFIDVIKDTINAFNSNNISFEQMNESVKQIITYCDEELYKVSKHFNLTTKTILKEINRKNRIVDISIMLNLII